MPKAVICARGARDHSAKPTKIDSQIKTSGQPARRAHIYAERQAPREMDTRMGKKKRSREKPMVVRRRQFDRRAAGSVLGGLYRICGRELKAGNQRMISNESTGVFHKAGYEFLVCATVWVTSLADTKVYER